MASSLITVIRNGRGFTLRRVNTSKADRMIRSFDPECLKELLAVER